MADNTPPPETPESHEAPEGPVATEAPEDAPTESNIPKPPTFTIKATGEDAKNWDFVSARPPRKTTNIIESIGHLIKSCLGGGILAMHEAFMGNGLISSLVLCILLGLLVAYCMLVLVQSAQRIYGRIQVPTLSYPDLAQAAVETCPFVKLRKFSKCLRYAVDVTIGIDLFGSCCVYQVVIARTIKQLVDKTDELDDTLHMSTRAYIACILLPCILITMILTLKYLAPFSIVADIFLVLVSGATIYYACALPKRKSIMEYPNYKSMEGLFEFVGVTVFSMEGVGVTMPIENYMTNPKQFKIVLAGGMSVVILLVMIVGFFGYWGFGEEAKSPVTLNFPFSPFPYALKVSLALMVYVTFALNFWVPFDLMWFYLKQRHPENKHWYWQRIYRACHVIIISLIAITFPNVSSFIGLIGSFCLSNMGFIYPAFIEILIDWEDPGLGIFKWRLWRATSIILFGIVVCVVGTYTNAKNLIKSTWGGKDEK